MNKKGFTLVELLAVIVIIALIALFSTAGVNVVKNAINKSIWEGTIALIESGAEKYGEDKKYLINKSTCEIEGVTTSNCLKVEVAYLIDHGYIKTKERNENNCTEENGTTVCEKVLVNSTLSEDNDDYYVRNGKYVKIYLENDVVYAEYIG